MPTRLNAILPMPVHGARPWFHLRVSSSIISHHLDVVGVFLWRHNSVTWQLMRLITLAHSLSHFIFSNASGAMSKPGFCGTLDLCAFSDYLWFQAFWNKGNALKPFIVLAPMHLKDIAKLKGYANFMKRHFLKIFCDNIILLSGERQSISACSPAD